MDTNCASDWDDIDIRKSPWHRDLASVSPEIRRNGLLATALFNLDELSLSPDAEEVHRPLWAMLHPLIHPLALKTLVQHCLEHMARADEDISIDQLPRVLQDLGKLQPRTSTARLVRRQILIWLDLAELESSLRALDDGTPLHPTVRLLVESAGLDRVEARLLDFLECHCNHLPLRWLLRTFEKGPTATNQHRLAGVLGCTPDELHRAQGMDARLKRLHLIETDGPICDLEDFVQPSSLLLTLIAAGPTDLAGLMRIFVDDDAPATRPLNDFPHLAQTAEQAQAVLTAALAQGESGVNLLLHGAPGTGKTAFAHSLVAAAGLQALRVRCLDGDGSAMSRETRLQMWQVTQRLLSARRDIVMIFDEAEDIFPKESGHAMAEMVGDGSSLSGRNKSWINQMLETNPVPTLWISNQVRHMDKAFLRRFMLPIAFHTPSRSVRHDMIRHHLGRLPLPQPLLDELAEDDQLNPGQLATAARVARLVGSEPPERLERMVRVNLSAGRMLMHGRAHAPRRAAGLAADPAFLNLAGPFSPQQLMSALQRQGRANVLCHGPSGTGKTGFAEMLAHRLDRQLVVRRASDLLSPYVGETEARLATMFATTDPQRSVLLLDEADSFLRDRRQARQSWEAVQVNELLQQMEHFEGIFLCVTNLLDHIDAAALRRFDLTLDFRALSATQRLDLFVREVHRCGAETLTPAQRSRLVWLDGLTLGDFAAVCRQFDLLDLPREADAFLDRLEAVHQLKQRRELPPQIPGNPTSSSGQGEWLS